MKKIVVINGKGSSGKDTFVSICEVLAKWPVYNFTSIAIIKKAAEILGWDGSKEFKDRKFLSDLKQLSIWYNDRPNEYLLYSIDKTEDNSINFVHIREWEEIQKFINSVKKLNKNYDIQTLLITRDTCDNIYGNVSDDEVDKGNYDLIIENNGSIFELELKCLDWLSKIGVGTYENWNCKESDGRVGT